jgi:hypothetical protein
MKRTIVIAILLLMGCAGQEGTIRLSVKTGGVDLAGLWIVARVEDAGGTGAVRQSTSPASYAAVLDAGLALAGVPAGESLVVAVEVRGGADEQLPVLYYGISDPFTLEAGEDAVVSVSIELVSPAVQFPETSASIALHVGGHPVSSVNLEQAQSMAVSVTCQGASAIALANDASMSAGRQDLVSGEASWDDVCQESDGWTVCSIPWSIHAGLAPSMAQLPDGRYTVHARFTDKAGYAGPLHVADVVLDGAPPQVAVAATTLLPPPGSLLSQVSAAGPGTTVVVQVVFNELVNTEPPPVLVATSEEGPDPIVFQNDFVPGEPVGALNFVATIAAQDDGIYRPTIAVSDVAGNTVELHLDGATFEVASTGKALEVVQSAFKAIRAPWGAGCGELGAQASGPGGRIAAAYDEDASHLWQTVFQFTDGSLPDQLRVYADEQLALELARISPDLAGPAEERWPLANLSWSGHDAVQVYLVGVDGAGNASPPVVVETTELVVRASPESPHDLRALEREPMAGILDPFTSQMRFPFGQAVAACDGEFALVRSNPTWAHVSAPNGVPAARDSFAMAYDELRGRAILHGGSLAQATACDTWEWDGSRWLLAADGAFGPGCVQGQPMVYDSVRGRAVLLAQKSIASGVWEWDGQDWEFRPASGSSPPARTRFDAAFDSARGRVVVFGGDPPSGGAEFDDTWEWDGTAWEQVAVDGPRPGIRSGHSMVYDASRGVTVLFGGIYWPNSGYKLLGDTWEWDGKAWYQASPQGSTPPANNNNTMVYDPVQERTVLLAASTSDVWTWDGVSWSKIHSSNAFGDRWGGGLVYDRTRERLMLFGGSDGVENPQGDLWVSTTGSAWNKVLAPEKQPVARTLHAMAYDAHRSAVTLFSGWYLGEDQDTWEYRQGRWVYLPPFGAVPERRRGPGLVYNPTKKRVMLFGGRVYYDEFDDLWEWSGTSWQQKTWNGSSPFKRRFHGMAMDTKRNRLVVFGGDAEFVGTYYDTWEWNGTSWTKWTVGSNPHPPAMIKMAMAYYPEMEKTYLYGGKIVGGVSDALWAWDGTLWTQIANDGHAWPPAMVGPTFHYDYELKRLILVGEAPEPDSDFLEVWSWDGEDWEELSPYGYAPSTRSGHAIAGTDDGYALLFGGDDGTGSVETWRLEHELSNSRPALQIDAALGDLGIAPQQIVGLQVNVHAGGDSHPYDAQSAGALVTAWQTTKHDSPGGAWTELGNTVRSVGEVMGGTAAVATWSTDKPRQARSFVTQRDMTMRLRVTPRYLTGPSPHNDLAMVAVDAVTVRVRYLPE